jgi:putative tryptophan/tyrosine transport system substrate-binding protein
VSVVVRRLVAALLVLLVASACTTGPSGTVADRPLVVVLRSVADPHQTAFLAELRSQRLIDGRDLELWPTGGDEAYADADEAAAALARLDRTPTLVVAYSTPLAQVAVDAFPGTRTVSVVNDPVVSGLVDDRERPEGHVTGVSFATPADRTLALANRLFPGLERIGYLEPVDDPAVPGHRAGILAAAQAAGIEVVVAAFDGGDEVRSAVDDLVTSGVDVAVLASANATVAAYEELRAAVAEAELPIVSNSSRADFAVLTLEPDGAEIRRQVARQVARLLAGDPVAQVPVEDPRRFRVVLDRTLARSLGAAGLDDGLLRQADEVR